ncbi:hypothetical protein KC340_g8575 [Hortaea werneckii]|nr:hypothetical protein KC342_g8923 [Hortaea werneckii]KAI7095646.1 hypothetical protein KC339_g10902 [Hortaea werneckii]KAI7235414.1 hypothetical protein KC365_g5583 [Hortaea werneckii]KAI7316684.1 hypothetical protein KC340_g8575 [Hortaea werneckii]
MAALVAYSDSEGSDTEPAPAPAPASTEAPKPAFSKTKEPRKIQVSLPRLQPEQDDGGDVEQPPAKRARTGGGLGGFNSFLPAPKRTSAPTPVKKGVSLKTSSEAAFSRAPPDTATANNDTGKDGKDEYDEFGNRRAPSAAPTTGESKKEGEDVKIVGKATKFKPLSVANNTKKKSKPAVKTPAEPLEVQKDVPKADPTPKKVEPPQPKPKRSLFSMQEDVTVPAEDLERENQEATESIQPSLSGAAAPAPPTPVTERDFSEAAGNSLEDVASDLKLTAAQRRHLFGRGGGGKGVNIANFNMDNEYAANEQIRQSGETIEHKAVKAVAPGKHSLQQLVNNARSNQESMEDKWAEGRRNQGGSQYGWGGQK